MYPYVYLHRKVTVNIVEGYNYYLHDGRRDRTVAQIVWRTRNHHLIPTAIQLQLWNCVAGFLLHPLQSGSQYSDLSSFPASYIYRYRYRYLYIMEHNDRVGYLVTSYFSFIMVGQSSRLCSVSSRYRAGRWCTSPGRSAWRRPRPMTPPPPGTTRPHSCCAGTSGGIHCRPGNTITYRYITYARIQLQLNTLRYSVIYHNDYSR
jgi:hypothetical protein